MIPSRAEGDEHRGKGLIIGAILAIINVILYFECSCDTYKGRKTSDLNLGDMVTHD